MLPPLNFSGVKLRWPHRPEGLCSRPQYGETKRTRTFSEPQSASLSWINLEPKTKTSTGAAAQENLTEASWRDSPLDGQDAPGTASSRRENQQRTITQL
jgi:hypothetical protein